MRRHRSSLLQEYLGLEVTFELSGEGEGRALLMGS